MSDIKIIEGLEPWEVVKRASEGEPVASRIRVGPHPTSWSKAKPARWNSIVYDYAIIDTAIPEINWEEFNYEFFNQYRGLPVRNSVHLHEYLINFPIDSGNSPITFAVNSTDIEFTDPGTGEIITYRFDNEEWAVLKRSGVRELRESPFYYWPGGECPVPGNVEVEVKCWPGDQGPGPGTAKSFTWDRNPGTNRNIVAFRLTGKLC